MTSLINKLLLLITAYFSSDQSKSSFVGYSTLLIQDNSTIQLLNKKIIKIIISLKKL